MTQKQQILEHLNTYGSITPLEALNKYGCMRLAAQIFDLKAEGNDIRTTIEKRVNTSGQQKHYARYWIYKEAS